MPFARRNGRIVKSKISKKNRLIINKFDMVKIQNNVLGAIGEHQTLSRLLLLGYQAAITNLSVENTAGTDIFCCDNKGHYSAIQVKTTLGDCFNTGISHKEFYDANGKLDLVKGRKFIESKVVGPWVMVQVCCADVPTFKFFVLSRAQIIEMIYENEVWYLTGYNRNKPLKGSGIIYIHVAWLYGHGVPANKNHIEWVNPFPSVNFEEAWRYLMVD